MIRRERYIQQIRPFIGSELIKVLTGIRRSGKSVLLNLIQDELLAQGVKQSQFVTFNFESFSNAKFCSAAALYEELSRRLQAISGKAFLFFDEIQEVDEWERCINSARVDFDCDIYITGSNAKLLSGELATYLGGRYVEFVIYPFSFEEYLSCIQDGQNEPDRKEAFQTYFDLGGMPFLNNLRENREASLQYLRDVYNSVILKDVVKRNNIREVDLMERIITYVIANTGHTFSARNISNYLKSEKRNVAPETVLNYIKACCDACLFYKLGREDISGKRILSVNEKYYLVDHGFREAVYGGNAKDIGQTLENIVCMEALRRGYAVTVGKAGEKEVDFIARKGDDKIYIQVAYFIDAKETADREFGVYDAIRDNYPKYVVSLDEFDMSRNGIKHRNIRDFLLADEWN